jgi:hypothetical protein
MSKVEKLVLEADHNEQLVLAIKILQKWHSGVSHYMTGVDVNGKPYLSLLWADPKGSSPATPLIAPLKDAEAIAHTIQSWLRTVEYGHEPDHDGSNTKGFRVTCEGPQIYAGDNSYIHLCGWDFYVFMTVQPFWNEYHK